MKLDVLSEVVFICVGQKNSVQHTVNYACSSTVTAVLLCKFQDT